METYESVGTDRRKCQLSAFIRKIEGGGRADNDAGGIVHLRQKYRRGDGSGRAYADWLILQNCTRGGWKYRWESTEWKSLRLTRKMRIRLRYVIYWAPTSKMRWRIIWYLGFRDNPEKWRVEVQITTDAAPSVQKKNADLYDVRSVSEIYWRATHHTYTFRTEFRVYQRC